MTNRTRREDNDRRLTPDPRVRRKPEPQARSSSAKEVARGAVRHSRRELQPVHNTGPRRTDSRRQDRHRNETCPPDPYRPGLRRSSARHAGVGPTSSRGSRTHTSPRRETTVRPSAPRRGRGPIGMQRRIAKSPRAVQRVFRAGQSRRRLLAVIIVAALLFALVIGRVALLQTSDAQQLQDAGRAQRTSVTALRAGRGVIFDRNGDELALSVPAVTITANPKLVTDPVGTAAVLAQLLGLSDAKRQQLVAAFVAKDRSFVYVARQVDDTRASAVIGLKLNGVEAVQEDRRTMPGGEVGKSIIGRTDIDGKGTAGIEMQFDATLTGTDGSEIRERDKDGRTLAGIDATTIAPVPGNDVVLTVDRSVQYTVEQALLSQVSTLGARGGTAIVMSTKTGEIIAMAGVRINAKGVYEVTSGNIAVVDTDEPGSVAKAITIAAALNEGTVTPSTYLEVPWQKMFSDTMLHDAEQHPTESWSVSKILVKSSNIGTTEVMLSLGTTLRETKEKQYSYMTAFGLGASSPLDFPGESKGLLKDWKKLEGAEQYTVGYGQGVGTTSIQLVTAMNVLANGGMYVAPKLLKATIGPDGAMTPAAPSATHRVVKPEVAVEMNAMMREVVCSGTGKLAQVDGVTIAGKTGTGLKAQPNGTYLDADGNRTYYASFVGFFPAEDPQVTVLVSIDEPPADDIARFGGTAAAPVFARIVPSIMHELNVTPPTTTGGCPAT